MLSQPQSTPKHPSSMYGPGSVGSQPPASPIQGVGANVPASPYAHPLQSPASVPPPPSPAQHQFTAPSPAPPPSPVQHLSMKSPASLPPPPSPANILYAKSPAAYIPPPSPRSSNATPILSPSPQSTPAQPQSSNNPIFLSTGASGPIISGGAVLTQPLQLQQAVAAGGQMFQLQLQPNVSVQSLASHSTKIQPISSQTLPITPNKGSSKQPQLLPKPSSANVQKSQSGVIFNKSSIATTSTVAMPAGKKEEFTLFLFSISHIVNILPVITFCFSFLRCCYEHTNSAANLDCQYWPDWSNWTGDSWRSASSDSPDWASWSTCHHGSGCSGCWAGCSSSYSTTTGRCAGRVLLHFTSESRTETHS